MQRRYLHKAPALAGLLLCTAAQADSQVPGNRTIVEISTYETSAVVTFSPSFTNSEGCTAPGEASSAAIEWSLSSEFRTLLTAVVAAMHAGSQVGFGLSGCSLEHAVPIIYRVDVTP